jgi:hypothetical protein
LLNVRFSSDSDRTADIAGSPSRAKSGPRTLEDLGTSEDQICQEDKPDTHAISTHAGYLDKSPRTSSYA